MAELSHLTGCGLPGIQRIPYGLHACHFYPDRQRSYTQQGRSSREIGEVMHAHECIFDRPDATWQVVARPAI